MDPEKSIDEYIADMNNAKATLDRTKGYSDLLGLSAEAWAILDGNLVKQVEKDPENWLKSNREYSVISLQRRPG